LSYISLRYWAVQRGTQQENSATKLAFTLLSWATLGRVNEASLQVMFICQYKLLITARLFVRGMKGLLLYGKQETYGAYQPATPIQEIHTTLIG